MCGQTKLQCALGVYSVVYPNVSVNYNVNTGTVFIANASETEVKDLGKTLSKIPTPYSIRKLSVLYTKNDRRFTKDLPSIKDTINATNIGTTKKGGYASYFDMLPLDTDQFTGDLSLSAGDDSGSNNCYKFYNLEITDTESPVVLTTKSNTSSENYCNNNCDPSKYKNGKCQYPYVPCSNAPGSDPTCCVKIQ